MALLLWVLLDSTEVGRFMYAIGGNQEAARLSGIRTRTLRISGFVIVAFTAADRRDILISSQGGRLHAQRRLPYLLLPAYAGAFLGAACFRPGEFNMPGTVVGVLFLGTIATGLTILNLQTYLINLVQGAILIVAVLLSTVALGAHERVSRSMRRGPPSPRRRGRRHASSRSSSSRGLVKRYPGVVALDHASGVIVPGAVVLGCSERTARARAR